MKSQEAEEEAAMVVERVVAAAVLQDVQAVVRTVVLVTATVALVDAGQQLVLQCKTY